VILTTRKVLEYTIFQPGMFLDYLAFPHQTSKYIEPLSTPFDYELCRAIAVASHEDAIMTLTSVADLAAIVTLAVGYEGAWPEVGGIRGNRVSFSEIIKLGERIRGKLESKINISTNGFALMQGRRRSAIRSVKGQVDRPRSWSSSVTMGTASAPSFSPRGAILSLLDHDCYWDIVEQYQRCMGFDG
jgi:hypothetical protein